MIQKEISQAEDSSQTPTRESPVSANGPSAGQRSIARKNKIELSNRVMPIARPQSRRLRGYAFDPSLSLELEYASVNMVTMSVPWESYDEHSEKLDHLQPGPVGEYLEVVDVDPASGCFYAPVNLNHPLMSVQDGLAPSELNPQFHQQMVYAVAMTTIHNFERTLGRFAFWSPHKPNDTTEIYVQRLRIYPHALRQPPNAYYSPLKKALLFGYFPASSTNPGNHLPGGIVYTCLSHDVVAHETTHALLDGMHPLFQEPTRYDTLAFHEAFADIVALFQHFSYPEVLRDQIAKTHGDLQSENLLGQLAQEFGQAIGQQGALRDALGSVDANGVWRLNKPDPTALARTTDAHARGSLLVAAVFGAFVSIYKSRIADLLRIATSGTGVLPAGQLHPDLVKRLSNEAAKSAKHILNMCIRALDYCPPVDLTFGDYLRALITADYDFVPADDLGYRVAVIDSFRRYGIYPDDVRNLSEDTLLWPQPWLSDQSSALPLPSSIFNLDRDWALSGNREHVYNAIQQAKAELNKWFKNHAYDLQKEFGQKDFSRIFGLDLTQSDAGFEVQSLRPSRRLGPEGDWRIYWVIEIIQSKPAFFDPNAQIPVDAKPDDGDFIFRGGCTLLVDSDRQIRYYVVKYINDPERLERQRQFLTEGPAASSLQALYFNDENHNEPFAFLHQAIE
jgi:hypothetical protein